jgi:hypothetical protein
VEVYWTHSTLAQGLVSGQLHALAVFIIRERMSDRLGSIKILTEQPEDRLMYWMSCCCRLHGRFVLLIALNFFVFAVESCKSMPLSFAICLWPSVMLNIYWSEKCFGEVMKKNETCISCPLHFLLHLNGFQFTWK